MTILPQAVGNASSASQGRRRRKSRDRIMGRSDGLETGRADHEPRKERLPSAVFALLRRAMPRPSPASGRGGNGSAGFEGDETGSLGRFMGRPEEVVSHAALPAGSIGREVAPAGWATGDTADRAVCVTARRSSRTPWYGFMSRNVFQKLDTYWDHEPCDGRRRSVGAEDWVGARVLQVPTERNPPGRLRFMGSDVFQELDTHWDHEPCDGRCRFVDAEDWVGARV